MKYIIEALREGKKTWSDLKQIKIKTNGSEKNVPERTLDRILKENLEFWGLAKKEDDFWVWYQYSKKLTKHNYDLAMNHSRILLTGFHMSVYNTDKYSQEKEYVAMKEHLKGHSEIYQELTKYEKDFTKMNTKVKQNEGVLKKFFPNLPLDPFTIHEHRNDFKPTTLEEEKLKDELEKEFDKFYWAIYTPLKSDLNSLDIDLTHGKPLEGKCSLCRNVEIIEEGVKP